MLYFAIFNIDLSHYFDIVIFDSCILYILNLSYKTYLSLFDKLGGNSTDETPDPIPNSTVKLCSANDTMS